LPEFVSCFLDDSHCDWDEIEFQYIFDMHFPDSKDVKDFFQALIDQLNFVI
jgi:hypothetical protein